MIDIPLDINGEYQEGNYKFVQYLNIAGVVLPGTYDLTVNVNFCNETPVASVSNQVDCIHAAVAVTDNTVISGWTLVSRDFELANARPLTSGSPYTTSGTIISVSSTTKIGRAHV